MSTQAPVHARGPGTTTHTPQARKDMMEPLCEAVKVEVKEEPTGVQASSTSQQPSGVDRVSNHSKDGLSQCDEIDIKEEEEEEHMEDFNPVTGFAVFVPAQNSKPSSTSDHSEDALSQCDEIGIKKEEEEDVCIKDEPTEDLDPVTDCCTFVPALKSKSRSTSFRKPWKAAWQVPSTSVNNLMSFVVVEFLDEGAVEVVHKSWIMKKENGMFCYWPPMAGASAKVKRDEIPDTEKWKLYEIRISSSAETYSKALEQAKTAEDNANVETEFEGRTRRATKKPARFGFSEDEEADDEDDNSLEMRHTPTVAVLPQPPQLNGVNERSDASSRDSSPLPQQPQCAIVQDGKENCMSDTEFRTTVLARLKTLEETQRLILNLLQSSGSGSGRDDVEDVLPDPVSSLEELDDLCIKVADKTFKRKLTLFLSSLGGHSLGDTVRRIFTRMGTNGVWSSYSLKGKKGKLAFADLPICKVVIRACLRNYTEAKTSEVENEISEALKHAPKRKGGIKYKEPGPKRRKWSAQESSDSND